MKSDIFSILTIADVAVASRMRSSLSDAPSYISVAPR